MAGVMENRAKLFCFELKVADHAWFTIEWRRSAQWGTNAVICNRVGEKMVLISGCGFDKESTAVAQLLTHLFDDGFSAHGGCGMNIVTRRLKEKEWILEKTHNTATTDGYYIRRATPEDMKN